MIWEPESGSPTAMYHWKPFPESIPITAACQRIFSPQPEAACDDPLEILDRMCSDCREIWHIVYTSIESAKPTIRACYNIEALQGAYQLANGVTLQKLLRSRLRQLGEIAAAWEDHE